VLHPASARDFADPLPGMPPVLEPHNLYVTDAPGQLAAVVRDVPYRIYVPEAVSGDVYEIDPATFKIIAHFPTSPLSQHVVPSWDF